MHEKILLGGLESFWDSKRMWARIFNSNFLRNSRLESLSLIGVKSAFLVILRQNKAKKSLGVLNHFDTPHSTQAYSRGACARMPTRQHFIILTSFALQNRPRTPRKSCSDTFRHGFIVSGLYFSLNRPEMHIYANLEQNMIFFDAFAKFWPENDSKKCTSGRFGANIA